MSSKRVLNVMSNEVVRLYHMGRSTIASISCTVPRVSCCFVLIIIFIVCLQPHRDYCPELYPNCIGTTAACSVGEWMSGNNNLVCVCVFITFN
jgi:hypothetical protein